VRKVSNTDEIRLSYVRNNVPNAEDDSNRSITFNGAGFDVFEPVADIGINVWDGFPSATAETNDTLPCIAFAGTDATRSFGFGLYFDAKKVLSVEENSFEDFTFYPNPVNDILNLSTKGTIEKGAIFTSLGQKAIETSVGQNKTSLNIAPLSTGVYFMKVKIDGNYTTYKIVKH